MDTKNPDALIVGLLAHLPEPGSTWPDTQRKLWLSLMEGAFNLIYKQPSAVEEMTKSSPRNERRAGLTSDYPDEKPARDEMQE